jgi:hypothetical protein
LPKPRAPTRQAAGTYKFDDVKKTEIFLTGKLKKKVKNTQLRYRECSSGARLAKMQERIENAREKRMDSRGPKVMRAC